MVDNVHILSDRPSLVSQILAEIRDEEVQKDSMRFRRNLERMGEIMALEISKVLEWEERAVRTPLGEARCLRLRRQPVLANILRAGLPLHQGLLNYFDHAENAFISAYRKHEEDSDAFEVEIEYLSSPPVSGKTVILCDPMLATGTSMVLAWKALVEQRGEPADLHVASVIASDEGLALVRDHLPDDTKFWLGAVDHELTPR